MSGCSGGEVIRSILLVEDEVLLAFDMQDKLENLGYRVLGPAGSVEKAHEILDGDTPAAAVLDVNLNGHSVAPVARRLRLRKVPCLLVTAYKAQDITHPALTELLLLNKPVSTRAVCRALEDLLR